jgi:3-demethylubiquinone-9 3-methyltransferase
MSVEFELEGQRFIALNAGPQFKFTEAISFFVGCDTQQEIDALWAKLTADGGAPSRCGWLKDKFGLSWQIVPNAQGRMLSDEDGAKATRVMNAMLQMDKLELKRLQQAYSRRMMAQGGGFTALDVVVQCVSVPCFSSRTMSIRNELECNIHATSRIAIQCASAMPPTCSPRASLVIAWLPCGPILAADAARSPSPWPAC